MLSSHARGNDWQKQTLLAVDNAFARPRDAEKRVHVSTKEEVMHRLTLEAQEILENLAESDPSVGDAMFVAYDPQWAQRNKVGRFGRMTLVEEGFLFHAAPNDMDREPAYEMADHNFMDFIDRWKGGEKWDTPIDKMIAGPPPPKALDKRSYYQSDYEKELLKSLIGTTSVTLMNPSFKTMSNAVFISNHYITRGIFVHVTAQLDHAWGADIKNFVAGSGGKLQMSDRPRGLCYLGTGLPKSYPDRPWVRMIQSPVVDPSEMYANYKVEYKEDCFVSRFEKKEGYVTTSLLKRDSPFYVYSPETVDKSFFGKQDRMAFFLESSDQLLMDQVDNRLLWHNPFFVDMKGDWQMIGEFHVRVQGTVLYDVEDSGTYLSRRSRTVIPGYTWVPISPTGSHWFTYSSLKPHSDYNVQSYEISRHWDGVQKYRVFTMGFAQPIEGVRQIRCPRDTIFVAKGSMEARWPLDSSDLALASWPVKEGEPYWSTAYMDSKCRVYSEASRRTDAISYRIDNNGAYVLEGLPRGKVTYLERFIRNGHSFVTVDNAYRDSFIFATAKDVEALVPSMSLHTGKWFSMRSLLSSAVDPQYGGQMSMNVLSASMNELMSQCSPKDFGDPGVTAIRIADQTGASVQLCFRQLLKNPIYIMWKSGLGHSAEFVRRSHLLMKFEGEPVTTDHFCIDGRTWADVLEHMCYSTKVVSFHSIPRHFMTVLQYNGYVTKYEDRGVYKLLHVKIPKR